MTAMGPSPTDPLTAWRQPPLDVATILGDRPWALVHDDALAVVLRLPDACCDALITDPPYSSGGLMRSDRLADPARKYSPSAAYAPFSGDNRDQRSWLTWGTLWLTECVRLVRPGGYLLVFADWRQLPALTDLIQAGMGLVRGIIPWDKGPAARAPHTGYARHQCEYIVWGTVGPCAPADGRGPFPGCYHIPLDPAEKEHLTGKPVALMRALARMVPPGGLILDPFAGSGSTGAGALLEDRRFLGIERAATAVAGTQQRLERAWRTQALLRQSGGRAGSPAAVPPGAVAVPPGAAAVPPGAAAATTDAAPCPTIQWLDPLRVVPDPAQPRQTWEPLAQQALEASVRVHGVLEPLRVAPLPDGRYRLLGGARRLRAALANECPRVPCHVLAALPDWRHQLDMQVAAHLHHAALPPQEIAQTLWRGLLGANIAALEQERGDAGTTTAQLVAAQPTPAHQIAALEARLCALAAVPTVAAYLCDHQVRVSAHDLLAHYGLAAWSPAYRARLFATLDVGPAVQAQLAGRDATARMLRDLRHLDAVTQTQVFQQAADHAADVPVDQALRQVLDQALAARTGRP